MSKIKEADMFEPLKEWLLNTLGCDAVYGEVHDIDVVALCGPVDIAIEMKTSVSMKLLEQVISRMWLANYVYICIPRSVANNLKRSSLVYTLAKVYGFGILSCSVVKSSYVQPICVEIPARYQRFRHKRGLLRHYITPYHEHTIGGATSKEKNSQYQQTIKRLKAEMKYRCDMSTTGWISINELLDHVETHYANPKASVAATLLEDWNSDWCESKIIDRKRMYRYIGGNNG